MKLTQEYSRVALRVAEQVSIRPAEGPPEEVKIDFFKDPTPPPPTHQPKFTQLNQEGYYKNPMPQNQSTQFSQNPQQENQQLQQQPTEASLPPANSQVFPINRPGTTINKI